MTRGQPGSLPTATLSFTRYLPAGGKLILLNSIQLLTQVKNGTVGGEGSNFLFLLLLAHD